LIQPGSIDGPGAHPLNVLERRTDRMIGIRGNAAIRPLSAPGKIARTTAAQNIRSRAETCQRDNMHFGQIWNSDNLTSEFENVFAPDLLTPEQFFDRFYKCANLEAERRMLQEMLLDAIECWQSISGVGVTGGNSVINLRERLYQEADFWIFGEYDNSPFFSFTQTCDSLGLNPDFVRRRLLEGRRESRRAAKSHAPGGAMAPRRTEPTKYLRHKTDGPGQANFQTSGLGGAGNSGEDAPSAKG